MNGAITREQGTDVGDVPEDGEAESDVLPRQVDETGVEIVVFVVVGVWRVRVAAGAVQLRYHDPCRGGYADDGEEDGEKAQYSFPEKGGVVGVHCGTRRARHGRGAEDGKCIQAKGMEGTGWKGRRDRVTGGSTNSKEFLDKTGQRKEDGMII